MENFGGNYCYKITMENFWRKYATLEEIWATLEEILGYFGEDALWSKSITLGYFGEDALWRKYGLLWSKSITLGYFGGNF